MKQVVGVVQDVQQQPLPPLAANYHLVVVPSQIVAYRCILRRGIDVEQVLIEWLGLSAEEHSWEDLAYIQGSVPTMKLEDKLCSRVGGDVTVALDGADITARLAQDLDGINTYDDEITDDTSSA